MKPLLVMILLSAAACVHRIHPPQALPNGQLAYARSGRNPERVTRKLEVMAERYCQSQNLYAQFDVREEWPSPRHITVNLKFHCQPTPGSAAPHVVQGPPPPAGPPPQGEPGGPPPGPVPPPPGDMPPPPNAPDVEED